MARKRISSDGEGLENHLTATEYNLFEEFVQTAKWLDKKGMQGSYQHIAEIAEKVCALKEKGKTAIPVLAAAIDRLKERKRSYLTTRNKKLIEFSSPYLAILGFGLLISCTIFVYAYSQYLFEQKMAVAGYFTFSFSVIMGILGLAAFFHYGDG